MAKGLGSGLGALFGEESVLDGGGARLLPIGKIEPKDDQPRSNFDEEKLAELAESIREHGLIQPVAVRPLGDGYYQLIAGERRWRAARQAGLLEIPANIMEADDREAAELTLIENLQREDLTPMEEAQGYESLMREYHLTQEQVAERVGKSRPVVANALRLLRLPQEVRELVDGRELSLSQARHILELEDPAEQTQAAKRAAAEGLSVKETMALVRRMKQKPVEKERKNPRLGSDGVDYMNEIEQELTRKFDRKIKIDARGTRGTIRIEYTSAEDFEKIYRMLLGSR